MLRIFSYRWVQMVLLLALLGGIVSIRLAEPGLVKRLRYLTFDLYNQLSPRMPSDQVVIVDIDEESLQKYGQWPWPRPIVAQIPVNLRAMGARVVAFDMVFAEPDRTSPAQVAASLPDTPDMVPIKNALKTLPDNDTVFAKMIAQAGNVVTGFVPTDRAVTRTPAVKTKWEQTSWTPASDPRKFMESRISFATNLEVISAAAAGNGAFYPSQDSDGIIRRVPLVLGLYDVTKQENTKKYPALSVEALRVALGEDTIKIHNTAGGQGTAPGITAIQVGDYTIPTESNGEAWVYFTGYRKAQYIPAWRILQEQVDPKRIQNKIVLVGTSAIGLKDLRATPLGDTAIPGVDIHAELIEQILTEEHLLRPEFVDGIEVWVMIGLCLLIMFLMPFVGALTLALAGGFILWGGFLFCVYQYNINGLLLDPTYPSIAVTVIYLAASLFSNLRTEVEKKAVRTAFSHYISPELIEELTQSPDKLKLGGETRDLTIMFTDIRNFTAIAESMDPESLIRLMNDFLTPMTDRVLQSRGTIDKYIGDAMMAFWNAPLDDPDHARHACEAALHMHEVLSPVNDALARTCKEEGRPFTPLKAGIGINTGSCAVGNMGSRQRFAYSALGDSVNLASRLESQTKTYGVPILIGEATQEQIPDFACLELDLIQVKGRTEPERIFYLLGDKNMAESNAFKNLQQAQNAMLSTYRAQDFESALTHADTAHKLGGGALQAYYTLFRRRIEEYLIQPPGTDWAGVYIAANK